MYCNLLQFLPCHWILLHIIYHVSLCSTRWNFMKFHEISKSLRKPPHLGARKRNVALFGIDTVRSRSWARMRDAEYENVVTCSGSSGTSHLSLMSQFLHVRYVENNLRTINTVSAKCRSVIAGFALHKAQERGGSTKAFTSSQSVSGSFWPLDIDFVLKFRAFAKLHLFCGVKSIRVKPIWLQHQLHSAWTQRCARPVCKGIATTQLKWKFIHC